MKARTLALLALLLAVATATAGEFPCAEDDRACLIGLLSGGKGGEPLRAALLLANFRDEATADALAAKLSASDPLLATAALTALVRIGEPAVPALLTAARSDHGALRAFGIYGLARIGKGYGADQVTDLALDPSSEVRAQVAAALEALGDAKGYATLATLADDHVIRVRAAAIHALGAIDHPDATGRIVAALFDPYPAPGNEAIRAIVEKGPAAVPALQKALISAPAHVAIRVCIALAWIGDPGANGALVRLLAATDPRVVQGAIYALAATGDASTVRALKVLRDPKRTIDGVTLGELARDAVRRIEARAKKTP
jgi:HEAT repeat protein